MDELNEVTAVGVEDTAHPNARDEKAGGLATFIMGRYRDAKHNRYDFEQRALKSYRNYRGNEHVDTSWREDEKSKVSIKVTKTKVVAGYNQVSDVMFGHNRFPLSVNPTTLPDGVVESISFDPQSPVPSSGGGQAPEAPDFQSAFKVGPGETTSDIMRRVNESMRKELEPVADKLQEGEGKTPSSVTIYPAMEAAKRMEKTIHDQLEEQSANKALRSTIFECCLFGTGIMKGPMTINKEYPMWEDGQYVPKIKSLPQISHVSVWNAYPDPDGFNMEELSFFIERHKLTETAMRGLKKQKHFRPNAIESAMNKGFNYQKEWWEHQMEDEESSSAPERFEVLEYWGTVSVKDLEMYDVDLPDGVGDAEEVNINAWLCGTDIIRLVINPFKPQTIPYYAVPYELNPYSFFGVGIAENMDDSQTLMNGFMRLAVDNAALSGNLIFEVDESALSESDDLEIYPGKVFKRQEGAPGQAVFTHQFQNVSAQNMQMFDKARVIADESTGLPSYAHGQTGVQGTGRTAAGISMLMGAASGPIRNVVKNFDDYLLGPIGRQLFFWNMQFGEDESIKGDWEVKAQGTESLMLNEVRSQRLMQFLGIVQNPVLAPFAKMDYIVRELAKSLDLDPDKVANSMSDAVIVAEIYKGFQTPVPPQQEGLPAGVQAEDPTGAGGATIGVGTAPGPNEEGFSGNV